MNRDASTGGNSPIADPASRPYGFNFIRYWLPVLLWCGVIFSASSDAGSSMHTSKFIRPVLRWLIPSISEESIGRVQLGVRKSAHMTEYAVLALLIWRALRKPAHADRRPWRWKEMGMGFGLAVLFAMSDEIHQTFVPSREGRVLDVLIDALGALLGLLALRAWAKWRGRCGDGVVGNSDP